MSRAHRHLHSWRRIQGSAARKQSRTLLQQSLYPDRKSTISTQRNDVYETLTFNSLWQENVLVLSAVPAAGMLFHGCSPVRVLTAAGDAAVC